MYIGWDIGIKNLSYCILDIDGTIKEWDIIDLTGMDACKFKCTNKKPINITGIEETIIFKKRSLFLIK